MKAEEFSPDYTNILDVLYNRRPRYLPLYEHNIDEPFIAKFLGKEVSPEGRPDMTWKSITGRSAASGKTIPTMP